MVVIKNGTIYNNYGLSDFKINSKIATTLISTIYKATHKDNKKYILKKMNQESSARREYEIHKKCNNNQHIVNIYGYFERIEDTDDDLRMYSYLVIEYIDGINFREYIDSKNVNQDLIKKYLIDVATGLNYLHTLETPIVHGDVKLENVMIESTIQSPKTSIAKLIDFGFSYDVDTPLKETGTLIFNPPEFIKWIYQNSRNIEKEKSSLIKSDSSVKSDSSNSRGSSQIDDSLLDKMNLSSDSYFSNNTSNMEKYLGDKTPILKTKSSSEMEVKKSSIKKYSTKFDCWSFGCLIWDTQYKETFVEGNTIEEVYKELCLKPIVLKEKLLMDRYNKSLVSDSKSSLIRENSKEIKSPISRKNSTSSVETIPKTPVERVSSGEDISNNLLSRHRYYELLKVLLEKNPIKRINMKQTIQILNLI
jgi:serine/threonine protein kinase